MGVWEGGRERHIYISCFLKIKQQQESEDKYQETVKILESGCLRGEGLGDGERNRGMAIFHYKFYITTWSNCLGFHFDKKVK